MQKIFKNKSFIFFIKLSIVLLSIGYIYRRIFFREDINLILNYYRDVFSDRSSGILLIIIMLLMGVNWTLESEKWRFMIVKVEKIGFLKSLKAVLTGVTVSIFTPNRIGEYVGRVFFLYKADRIKAVIITIISSAGQLLITLVVGNICLIFYVMRKFPEEIYLIWIFLILLVLFSFIWIWLFINTNYFLSYFYRIKLLRKIRPYIKVLSYYSVRDLSIVLGLSAIRYLVFTLQFLILLRLLNVNVNFWLALESVGLIFLSLSIIPTFALTEVGIRGSVAIYFLSKFSSNEIGIVTASFTLWFINLVIPALIGSFFLFGAKVIKNNNQ